MTCLVPLLLVSIAPPTVDPAAQPPACVFDSATRLLTCHAEPAVRLPIPGGFRFLGGLVFDLGEKARVDRRLLARVEGDRVEALLVLQFEGFLPGVEGRYAFSIPPADQLAGSNYRFSPEPVGLGGQRWVHNTWAFDNAAAARENPGYESDRTIRFLADQGLELPSQLIMSRFVRAVGEDARRELILFYMEPLALHGHTVADFPDGGPPSEAYDRLSAEVTERSLAVFQGLEEPTPTTP
jgi:hypothetical protein